MNNNISIFEYIRKNLAQVTPNQQTQHTTEQDTEKEAYRNTAISNQIPALLQKLTDTNNVYYETGFPRLDKMLGGGLEPGASCFAGGL